jgi:uncharacterized protein with WD repeat
MKDYVLSNSENYAITFSGYPEAKTEEQKGAETKEQKENVFVWDILKNDLLRGFAITKEEKFENFKWSPDSKFFGRLKNDILIVYETPKIAMIAVCIINNIIGRRRAKATYQR